jgi:alpha-glucosidase
VPRRRGDLCGIEAHQGHRSTLRVVAVWLSPIFPAPMADFRYDVSDYRDTQPLFGSLADLDSLVTARHSAGIKVILG